MRLQLIIIAAICVLAVPAVAQHQASARVDVYDDGWITVVAPSARGKVSAGARADVSATYAVDVISGATPVSSSVDAVSGATRFEEVRHGADIGGGGYLGKSSWRLDGRYGVSVEPDYETHLLGLGASGDLFKRMVTLSVQYTASFERLMSVHDEQLSERTLSNALDVSWAQILGRTTTLTARLRGELRSCSKAYGCEASPYRYVPLSDGVGAIVTVQERHPESRLRGAAALDLSQYLGAGFALHVNYRYYHDSWQIGGHSAATSIAWGGFGERLIIRLGARGSLQSAASFYQARYETGVGGPQVPDLRTSDRELSGLRTASASLRARWSMVGVGPFARLGLTARVAHTWFDYPDYPALSGLQAWIAGGGVHAEF